MKILFVAYCFAKRGQTMIGVYKRCLRIAMEIERRGHTVQFFCPGRSDYHDEYTRLAETRLVFTDELSDEVERALTDPDHRGLLHGLARLQPDLVVIGEAPLEGVLLEMSFAAVELGIPVVLLDNIYHPSFVDFFCRLHMPLADAAVLTGPSSFQVARVPAYICQVPPYIDYTPEAQAQAVEQLGLTGERLITVLAYDENVEKLAFSVLNQFSDEPIEVLIISQQPARSRQHMLQLARRLTPKVQIIAPPADGALFGLIAQSRLSICKSGHMQIIECLSLHTPVLVFSYLKQMWSYFDFPDAFARFVHSSSTPEASGPTMAAVRQMLATPPQDLRAIHDGRFGAAAQAADYIEQLPRGLRDTRAACRACGISETAIQLALSKQHGGHAVVIETMRATVMAHHRRHRTFALLCGYTVQGQQHWRRLEVDVYRLRILAALAFLRARRRTPGQALHFSAADRLIIRPFRGSFANAMAVLGEAAAPPHP